MILPGVPGIVTLICKNIEQIIYQCFFILFEPLNSPKFKAQAHLPAFVRVSRPSYFTLPECVCVSRHAFVFPGMHFSLHKGHNPWHTLYNSSFILRARPKWRHRVLNIPLPYSHFFILKFDTIVMKSILLNFFASTNFIKTTFSSS